MKMANQVLVLSILATTLVTSGCKVTVAPGGDVAITADATPTPTTSPTPSPTPDPTPTPTPADPSKIAGNWSACVTPDNSSQYGDPLSGSLDANSMRMYLTGADGSLTAQYAIYGSSDCTGDTIGIRASAGLMVGDPYNGLSIIQWTDTYQIQNIGASDGFYPVITNWVLNDSPTPHTVHVNADATQLCMIANESWSLPIEPITDWATWISSASADSFVSDPTTGMCFDKTMDGLVPTANGVDQVLAMNAGGGDQALTGNWGLCQENTGLSVVLDSTHYTSMFGAYADSLCATSPVIYLESKGTYALQTLSPAAATGFFPVISDSGSIYPSPETLFVSEDGSQLCYMSSENWIFADSSPASWSDWPPD